MVGSAVGHNTFAALILSLDAAAIVLVLLTYKSVWQPAPAAKK